MSANTAPRFTNVANTPSLAFTSSFSANTKSDGAGTVGTDIGLLFTAGTNGSFVDAIVIMPAASAAATNTAQTVIRFYISTKTSGVTSNADTHLIAEVSLPAIPADHSTNAVNPYVVPIGRTIPSGTTILVSSHAAAAANTLWQVTAFGGDY